MTAVPMTLQSPAPLRVAVRASDAARSAALTERVIEAGHVVANESDADVALLDQSEALSNVPCVVIGPADSDAAGQLSADASAQQLDATLRAVAAGLFVRPLSGQRFAELDDADVAPLLTPREIEVLIALSEGLSNKATARRLDISQHTVKFHVESIFRKLDVTTRAEAVAKGLRHRIMNL